MNCDTTYEAWTVVAVPLGASGCGALHPAAVVSTREFNQNGTTILAPMTSARRPAAEGDIRVEAGTAGLAKDSVIRMKLFTIDTDSIAKKLGELPEAVGQALGDQIFSLLQLG
ncbi:MAG TPA: type II toxin-antitoxin system PemK/MazF family toxin [Bryobacteraceae bacterium]|nr:type II toxin-antitoxin system PemK/MazF family toxin [Bryobacteraceae bacterium]